MKYDFLLFTAKGNEPETESIMLLVVKDIAIGVTDMLGTDTIDSFSRPHSVNVP